MRPIPTHRIVADDDLMLLFDHHTTAVIVKALRTGPQEWTLKADGVEDKVVNTGEVECAYPNHTVAEHVSTRCAAVDAMINLAHELLPHEFITTSVPFRKHEDGTKIRLRDEP